MCDVEVEREKKVKWLESSALGISPLGTRPVDWFVCRYKHIQLSQQVVIALCLLLAMTENLLPAFNGQLDLRTAYNWNQSQVSFPDMLNLYQNGY